MTVFACVLVAKVHASIQSYFGQVVGLSIEQSLSSFQIEMHKCQVVGLSVTVLGPRNFSKLYPCGLFTFLPSLMILSSQHQTQARSMESVRSKKPLKSKGHHPGSNRRTIDHKPSVIPMGYCVRERPLPNSKKIIWHDSYVILWAHPEVPGSIPPLGLSILFSPQTAPKWVTYLFVNFDYTIQ